MWNPHRNVVSCPNTGRSCGKCETKFIRKRKHLKDRVPKKITNLSNQKDIFMEG